MSDESEIYKGGFYALMQKLDQRQRPFRNVEIVIPPADIDLDLIYQERVPAPHKTPKECLRFSAEAKWVQLQAEFEGQSALFLLHAMMIAIARRRDPPEAAVAFFLRMWAEKGDELAEELPTRWLISAATTFADVGGTSDQRALGMGLSVLFDLIKLHDSERRITGQPGDKPFRRRGKVERADMPLEMNPYSLKGGDLDRTLLARLWHLCERDPIIRPLGVRMLWMVMTDPRTIFARVQKFKPRDKK